MKKLMMLTLMLVAAIIVKAQTTPVQFTSQLVTTGYADAEIVFSGTMAPGWHVYSTELGNDGPISATFNVTKMDGVELIGKLTARGEEINKYDKLFEMQLRYFENKVQFVQKVRFLKSDYTIDAYLEYGSCNDESCMPPAQVEFKAQGKSAQFCDGPDCQKPCCKPEANAVKSESHACCKGEGTASKAECPMHKGETHACCKDAKTAYKTHATKKATAKRRVARKKK